MKLVRGSIVTLLTIAVMSLGALRAEATPLLPGTTVVPATVLTGFGGVELDSVFYANVGNNRFRVDLAAAVYRNAAGKLDFYYQVTNLAGSIDDLRRASMAAFGKFATDVFQITLGTSIGCSACASGFFRDGTQSAADADRDVAGNVVGFNFAPPGAPAIQPGETSLVLAIRTDATFYEPGAFGVINGRTHDVDAFQPAVAEPTSLALFGLGLLGTGAAIRRRRRNWSA